MTAAQRLPLARAAAGWLCSRHALLDELADMQDRLTATEQENQRLRSANQQLRDALAPEPTVVGRAFPGPITPNEAP